MGQVTGAGAVPRDSTGTRPLGPRPSALSASQDPKWVRFSLTGIALTSLTLLVFVPVVAVFVEAFADGFAAYWHNLTDPDTVSSILLTLFVACCAVPLNVLFGVAAAWAVTRFRFRGRTVLVSLIDLPFAISPVVAGLMFVLLFGMQGYFGPWLARHGIPILFTPAALVLVTTFTTMPFVARELIPVMEAIGPDEELAALSLGASGWQIFRRITVPNIKWGLLYGVILCTARAMGEFGAVYVVGGRIAGETNTMPLQVEMLFNGFNSPGAFAVASVLTGVGLVALVLKSLVEEKKKTAVEKGTGGVSE